MIGLGRFGFGLFDVETFGGIDDLGFRGIDLGRHGNAGAGDEIHFYAGIAATDAAPGFTGALNPDADKEECGERDVEEDRVREVAFEGEVVGGGGVGHGGIRTASGCVRTCARVGCGGEDAELGDRGQECLCAVKSEPQDDKRFIVREWRHDRRTATEMEM